MNPTCYLAGYGAWANFLPGYGWVRTRLSCDWFYLVVWWGVRSGQIASRVWGGRVYGPRFRAGCCAVVGVSELRYSGLGLGS